MAAQRRLAHRLDPQPRAARVPRLSRLQLCQAGASHHRQQGDCVLDLHVLLAFVARTGAADGEGGFEVTALRPMALAPPLGIVEVAA
jgi:hypothetical protein